MKNENEQSMTSTLECKLGENNLYCIRWV